MKPPLIAAERLHDEPLTEGRRELAAALVAHYGRAQQTGFDAVEMRLVGTELRVVRVVDFYRDDLYRNNSN